MEDGTAWLGGSWLWVTVAAPALVGVARRVGFANPNMVLAIYTEREGMGLQTGGSRAAPVLAADRT